MFVELEEFAVDSPEWHEARTHHLGASEVAAVLGLSKFQSPYGVWQAKMGVPNEIPENLAFFGRALEEPIAQWLREKHPELGPITDGISIRSTVHPWLSASPDRMAGDIPVEIKTSSAFSRSDWDDGVPDYYKIQSLVQQGILGAPYGWLAVLHGGNSPELYRIDFDAKAWELIVQHTRSFWDDHVTPKVAPPPTTLEEASARWQGDPDLSTEVDAIEGGERLLELWEEHGRQQAISVETIDLLNNIKLELQKAMGEATELTYRGQALYQWRRNKPTRRFDAKAFKADHPDLYEQYVVETQGARPFKRIPMKEITNE